MGNTKIWTRLVISIEGDKENSDDKKDEEYIKRLQQLNNITVLKFTYAQHKVIKNDLL